MKAGMNHRNRWMKAKKTTMGRLSFSISEIKAPGSCNIMVKFVIVPAKPTSLPEACKTDRYI